MSGQFKLYGLAVSLYTGRARSYLRKQHIDYREVSPSSEHFLNTIVPRIKRWIVPVLETPGGEIVQDGVDIIDWFEHRGLARLSAYPPTVRHRLIAHVFELFGAEGLLRPAMHYRWNFPEANDDFLRQEFGRILVPEASRAERDEAAKTPMGRMREAAVMLGVTPQTIPAIEAFYTEFLDALERHFEVHPYLLGGRPSLGDYALYAALKPHLGRDPYPAMLMQSRASMVWRWTERMGAPDADMSEYKDYPEDWIAQDGVPDTLKALLRFVSAEYLPEYEASLGFVNGWLAGDSALTEGVPVAGEDGVRVLGLNRFSWRGTLVRAGVLPYRFYVLQRLQDTYDALDAQAKAAARDLFGDVGLLGLVDKRTNRRVERRGHVEVWGAARPRNP